MLKSLAAWILSGEILRSAQNDHQRPSDPRNQGWPFYQITSSLLLTRQLVFVLAAVPLAFVCVSATAEAAAQTGGIRPPASNVTIEANPQLFATMCALYAAGYEADLSAAGSHPIRARVRTEMLRQQGPAAQALRAYYRRHELTDLTVNLSRYVSFALVAGPPPKFAFILRRDELPPDVLAIEDFSEVLANFYREAQIERFWTQVQPAYDREIERLSEPVSQQVMTSTGYLREILKPSSPRTFAVYIEPMVGGKTNFRNYGDHYVITFSPSGEIPVDDVRHAFLHFLLDPLAIRYPGVVAAKRPLLNIAARAPHLPNEYKDDFPAFLTECLVRAAELRLRRLPPDKLAAAIDEAERDGYVLVRPLSRELSKFEKAEPAMSFYFPDLVRGIVVADETKRLQSVTFAPAVWSEHTGNGRTAGASDVARPRSGVEENPELADSLREGERQIVEHNGAAATAIFQRVLEKYPEQPRALYGLAVAETLQGNAERAKELFQRLVVGTPRAASNSPDKDPLILAWSHVYLGRIYDVERNRELAVSEYRAALAVPGAPEPARQAAQRGIEKGYEPVARPN